MARAVWIWLSVHAIGRGTVIIMAATVLAFASGAIRVDTFGFARFDSPFPIALLAAGVAAVGVATASVNTAQSDALRHRFVHVILESTHTVVCFVIAAGLLSIPAVSYGYADAWAVVRNTAINTTLAMVALILRRDDQLWLPPVLATMLTALFGSGGPDYTWDILLSTEANPLATGLSLIALAAAIAVRTRRLRY